MQMRILADADEKGFRKPLINFEIDLETKAIT